MFDPSIPKIEPVMIDTLATAFDLACTRFAHGHGGRLPSETMRNSIAQRMVNCAEEGEIDIDRIIAYGLRGTAHSGP